MTGNRAEVATAAIAAIVAVAATKSYPVWWKVSGSAAHQQILDLTHLTRVTHMNILQNRLLADRSLEMFTLRSTTSVHGPQTSRPIAITLTSVK